MICYDLQISIIKMLTLMFNTQLTVLQTINKLVSFLHLNAN